MTHVFLYDANEAATLWRSLLKWATKLGARRRHSGVRGIDPRDIPEAMHHDVGLTDIRPLHPKRYLD
ncbi:hypothetical protein A33O_17484 [Nitratireductor aquibiodomus RA22]|uniref:Uncharacterized protein n=2 Tax=Nitratireductor aquibiodomus TaxID=204799 RepID=A0A1H4IMA4_9HYPH|nr:hypothetical protein [Nitratireductor aquibiodomus]EIM72964.1 hypothetical protein A33O_17484 [Nitratireductor aquibiodomus RA22]SEB34796.1 hypothetical protein SAMN05216452_0135 [Nitratireductor aquibiodomus]